MTCLTICCSKAGSRKQLTSCLRLQIFILRQTSGVAPTRGRGCTTSIPSTGSRFSRAINLPPASTGAPGLTSSTGGKGVACRDTPAQLLSKVLCILHGRRIPCLFSLCCCSFRLCSHDPLTAVGGVSVNVPQFFVPPVDSMSQVSVMDLRSAEATGFVSDPCETRRTVGLPKVSRESLLAPD